MYGHIRTSRPYHKFRPINCWSFRNLKNHKSKCHSFNPLKFQLWENMKLASNRISLLLRMQILIGSQFQDPFFVKSWTIWVKDYIIIWAGAKTCLIGQFLGSKTKDYLGAHDFVVITLYQQQPSGQLLTYLISSLLCVRIHVFLKILILLVMEHSASLTPII